MASVSDSSVRVYSAEPEKPVAHRGSIFAIAAAAARKISSLENMPALSKFVLLYNLPKSVAPQPKAKLQLPKECWGLVGSYLTSPEISALAHAGACNITETNLKEAIEAQHRSVLRKELDSVLNLSGVVDEELVRDMRNAIFKSTKENVKKTQKEITALLSFFISRLSEEEIINLYENKHTISLKLLGGALEKALELGYTLRAAREGIGASKEDAMRYVVEISVEFSEKSLCLQPVSIEYFHNTMDDLILRSPVNEQEGNFLLYASFSTRCKLLSSSLIRQGHYVQALEVVEQWKSTPLCKGAERFVLSLDVAAEAVWELVERGQYELAIQVNDFSDPADQAERLVRINNLRVAMDLIEQGRYVEAFSKTNFRYPKRIQINLVQAFVEKGAYDVAFMYTYLISDYATRQLIRDKIEALRPAAPPVEPQAAVVAAPPVEPQAAVVAAPPVEPQAAVVAAPSTALQAAFIAPVSRMFDAVIGIISRMFDAVIGIMRS